MRRFFRRKHLDKPLPTLEGVCRDLGSVDTAGGDSKPREHRSGSKGR